MIAETDEGVLAATQVDEPAPANAAFAHIHDVVIPLGEDEAPVANAAGALTGDQIFAGASEDESSVVNAWSPATGAGDGVIVIAQLKIASFFSFLAPAGDDDPWIIVLTTTDFIVAFEGVDESAATGADAALVVHNDVGPIVPGAA